MDKYDASQIKVHQNHRLNKMTWKKKQVAITLASIEGSSDALKRGSLPTICTISWSLSIPIALRTIIIGIYDKIHAQKIVQSWKIYNYRGGRDDVSSPFLQIDVEINISSPYPSE